MGDETTGTGPNEGYIALHRRIREHPYWQDPERLRAWIDILFMAAWKPHRRMVGTRQVFLPRGSFVASERFLAKRWHWSRGRARRFLDAARESREIEPIGETGDGTIYLVVKYEDYQDWRPTPDTTDETTTGPPSVPPPDHHRTKEKKEEERRTKDEDGGWAPVETRDEPVPAEQQQEAVSLMEQYLEAAAAQVPDGMERKRLRAELELLVTGDDISAWRTRNGDLVPWPGRPPLMKLALRRWYLDRDTYPKPRSALIYTVQQQLNPFHVDGLETFTSDQEQEHYRDHREGTSQRRYDSGGLERVHIDGGVDPNAGREAQAWAADHPDEYEALKAEVATEKGYAPEDLDQLQRIEVVGLALERIRAHHLEAP